MEQKNIKVNGIDVANDKPFVLFGGMNVLESRDMAMAVCEKYVEVTSSWVSRSCSRRAGTRPTAPPSTPTAVRVWKRG